MPMKMRCPNVECGKTLNIPDGGPNRRIRCPQCKTIFQPPVENGTQPAPAPAAVATMEAGAVATMEAPPVAPPELLPLASPEPPPILTAPIPSNDIPHVINRFEVRSRLGAGAFGTVYRAYDPQLDREVALKVPQPGVLDNPKRIERFLREAKAAAQLRHPHIVPVYDAGHDGAVHYIASAFIDGKPLADAVDEDGMDCQRAARIVSELAEALAYAHALGIVHRDIKPANIMLDTADQPHLMDFGLAARLESTERLTHDGAVLGTPAYMAPEQAKGQQGEAKPESDQYSLGVVLYELLCGRTPFEGPPQIVLFNVINQEPPTPRSIRRGIPRDLETICLKAMAKRPEDRYPDASGLGDDLRRWMEGEPIRARRLGWGERATRWLKKEPKLAAAGAITLASLIAVAVLLTVRVGQLVGEVLAEREDKLAAQKQKADVEAELDGEKTSHEITRGDGYLKNVSLAKGQLGAEDTTGGIHTLELCPTGYRGWEWHHLQLLSERAPEAMRLLEGEHNGAAALAFSPDSRFVIALDHEAKLIVWDLLTGKVVRTVQLKRPPDAMARLALSGDGKRVVTCFLPFNRPRPRRPQGEPEPAPAPPDPTLPKVGEVMIWDAQTGTRLATIKAEVKKPQVQVSLSHDGQRLALAESDWNQPAPLKLWDAQTGEQLVAFETPFENLQFVAFSPDGSRLATISGGFKTLEEEVSAQEEFLGEDGKKQTRTVTKKVTKLAPAPQTARLWEAQTGKEVYTLDAGNEGVQTLIFSPDGKLLATSGGGMMAVTKKVPYTVTRNVTEERERVLPDGTREKYQVTKPVHETCYKEVSETVGGGGGGVRLWDAGTGKHLLTLGAGEGGGGCCGGGGMAFSPDGRRLAIFSSDPCEPEAVVTLWDTRTGKNVFALQVPNQLYLQLLAFSPDGLYLAGAGGHGPVVVWSARGGRVLVNYPGHRGHISCLSFSPDSQQLSSFSQCNQSARVWDARTGKEVLAVNNGGGYGAHGGPSYAVPAPHVVGSYSPGSGTLLAYGYGHGQRYGHGPGGGCIGGLSFTTNNRWITSGGGGAGGYGGPGGYHGGGGAGIRIWDRATAKEMPARPDGETLIAISPDGARIAVASGGMKTAYRDEQKVEKFVGPDGTAQERTVTFKVPYMEQAPVVVRVIDTETGAELCTLQEAPMSLATILFSQDGERLAGSTMNWDPMTGQQTGDLRVWSAVTGQVVLTHKEASAAVALSPDGRLVASANQVPLEARAAPAPAAASIRTEVDRLWRLNLLASLVLFQPKGEVVSPPPPAPRPVFPGGPRPPAKPPQVKVWDLQTGKEVFTLTSFGSQVGQLTFAPDGRSLVTETAGFQGPRELKLWDMQTGKELLKHGAVSADPVFSPDGSRIALASGGATSTPQGPGGVVVSPVALQPPAPAAPKEPPAVVKVFDTRTGKELNSLAGHTREIAAVAWSFDGRQFASASGERGKPAEIKVWSMQSGGELFTFRGHTGPINVVVFSPDGSRLASGGDDRLVRVWTVNLARPAAVGGN